MKPLTARQYRNAYVKQVKRGQKQMFSIKPGGQQFTVIDGQHTRIAPVAAAPQITPGYLTVKEVARRYAAFVSGTGIEADVLAIRERWALIEHVKSGAVRAMHRNQLTPVHTDARGMTDDDYLAECRLSLDDARRYLIEHDALNADDALRILTDAPPENEPATRQTAADHAATENLPLKDEPHTYRPTIGWQVELFDSWLDICRTHSRRPSATEAIRWLKRKSTSGVILNEGQNGELWWKPQRGIKKKVAVHTVESVISGWKTKGVLPA